METLRKLFTPKVIAALVAGLLAVAANLWPEYSGLAGVLAGLVVGKEALPQTVSKETL